MVLMFLDPSDDEAKPVRLPEDLNNTGHRERQEVFSPPKGKSEVLTPSPPG